jgi:protein-arginine deiminase
MALPPPIVDLRADVNRNGLVDLADITEDKGEETWDEMHGAIFMANIDDDENRCPKTGQTDSQYAACHDAADSVINGADDLQDLARIMTVPWNDAYADAMGVISVNVPNRVRLFKKNQNGAFVLFNPATSQLDRNDLATGVELAIEALDIVRDTTVWDGFVDVTLTVTGTDPLGVPMPATKDRLRMRVAPMLFRHHLHAARKVYVTNINSSSSAVFRADLNTAAQAAALPEPIYEYFGSDQWTQDFFETAYTSMPAPNGTQHVMHVNVRSANYANGTLRTAGRIVYQLRGKDVAALVQYDPQHPDSMNTLNSFGNLETVPPYSHAGKTYALGRVIRGSTPSRYPDRSFDRMVNAQEAQPTIYINTEWLQVGHVDETMTFIKTNSPRGWAMGVNDPTLARTMLQNAQNAGYGNVRMFVGKYWSGTQSAEVSINQVLADPDVMNDSAQAAIEVAGQLEVLKNETGITDAEMIRIPFLHQPTGNGSVAYQPGTVNGIYLSDTDFAPPKPWGPNIGGQDIFEAQLVDAFATYGISVHFVENWNLYHRLSGEVHCGTNTTRVVPNADRWWESMP